MIKKKLIVIVSFLILIYLIISSVKSILEFQKSGLTVTEYARELKEIEKKNQEFKLRLEEVKKPEFIEKEAREKLGMGKSGESIVIMPKITIMPKKVKEGKLANWEKWWQLFF